MMIARLTPAFAALIVLAGCGAVVSKISGVAPASLQVAAKPDAPHLSMTLENRNIILTIAKVESQNGVAIYAAADGPQVFLRDGVILGTRGFGPDLMSAQAPSLATLRSGADHSRSYTLLDGTDTLRRETFACSLQRKGQSLDETCTSPNRVIRNQFSFDSHGKVVNSRQWLGDSAGYAKIAP